jgi:hypothetical protein
MKTVVTLLIGVAVGAVGVYFGQPYYEGISANMTPQCRALVRLSLSGNQIVVKPENTCLHRGRALSWEVNGGAGDKVEIDFKKEQGPFDHAPNNPHNPRKGHYEMTGPGEIDSNPASARGRWEYKVTWTPAGGQPITLDPEVCIRGG